MNRHDWTNGFATSEREPLEEAWSLTEAVYWSVDLADGTAEWGCELDEVLGVRGAPEDAVRQRLCELVAPLVEAARIAPSWQVHQLEQRCEQPGGWMRPVRFRARRRGDVLIGVAIDITGAVEPKQELADLAERYRHLVELSPNAICVHQDGVAVYVNPATVRMLGAESSTQIVGRPVVDFVAEDSRSAMREQLASLAAPGAATERGRAVLRRLNGDPVVVEVVAVRITWEGRPAFQVIMRDITADRAAEAALRYQAALVEHVSNAIIATTHDGRVTSWNPAAARIYGRPAEQALGQPVDEVVGAPLDPAVLVEDGQVAEATHRRADGAALTISMSAAQMDGGYVLVCTDETALRRAQRHFATVVDALAEGVVVVGANGLVESANPAALQILGTREEDFVGTPPQSWPLFDETGGLLPPRAHPPAHSQRTGKQRTAQLVRTRRGDGSSVWLSLTSRPLNPDDEPPHPIVLSFTDVTESRAIRERLEWDATHDPLTGLANRTLLLRRLDAALHARQRRHDLAVLFIDLDNFKVINDSLGHSAGDKVLCVVSERLRRLTRQHELVGRLGGDEFVVLSPDENDVTKAQLLARQVRRCLADPITVGDRQLHVDASVGIVLSPPGDPRPGADVLRDADVAMYEAKKLGRGRAAVFDVRLRKRVQRRLNLEQDLRHAVSRGQLWMAYQPIVNLRTHRVGWVEGLLRWTHPVHGTIPPGEFIPLAEESDLINSIGIHALRMATREIAAHRRQRTLPLQLKANLSARQLDDPHFAVAVHDALEQTGLPPSALCLEITESTLMQDPEAAEAVLNGLRELGVKLAIDDFGTGYSALALLHRLPLDTLKIDRSFIAGRDGTANEPFIASIVALAHTLNLNVVAEGVETAEQLATIRRLGCDEVQGFYFGRPVPIDELPDAA
ncbi:GGDEF domain-containing protein [Saccharopolyspora subtropica]|uniref:EAL domain-containing protein n=1 Tax=Saccharopolyspora thermophila TaxID=89367 RepID=A0A917JVU9_9PSEU|nr:EAL domain-containing protein [Saccharopolyspora subtropica]GGI84150.1 GGDEF domain-containing protein [Saccharopolyspora subtropica]